ncbi:rho GTPase-activating protein 7 isoform 2-T2 [Spinachia spinachia]
MAWKKTLRRSFSEHVKDSTNGAWDVFWRSVRETRLSEIEAKEACDWLQAAGFPQYVQLFRDCRVPIDTEWAKRDHHFLDEDALDSLCRRLSTLNKSVEMRLEPRSKRRGDDLKEEDFCAISPNWTYDRRGRRWRRLAPPMDILCSAEDASPRGGGDGHDVSSIQSSSSTDSEGHKSGATATPSNGGCSRCSSTHAMLIADPSVGGSYAPSPDVEDKPPRTKGTGLLRRMEKLRLRGATGLLSSAQGGGCTPPKRPVQEEEERTARLHGPSSPQVGAGSRSSSSPSSRHTGSGSSNVSTPSPVTRVRSSGTTRDGPNDTEDYRNPNLNRNDSSSGRLIFQVPNGHKPGTFPTSLAHKHGPPAPVTSDTSVNWRTGSFHGYRGRHSHRVAGGALDHRLSIYDNVPDEGKGTRLLAGEDVFSALDGVLERIRNLQQLVSTWSENLSEEDRHRGSSSSSLSTSSSQDSPGRGSSAASPCLSSPGHVHLEAQEEEEEEEVKEEGHLNGEEPKTRSSQRRCRASQQQTPPPLPAGPGVEGQSVSQFVLLQKLSLLKLTALMDKYSPSSKQGWNWTVPKPLRKTKVLEAKGRRVFGAPLLLGLQQTGEPLPPSILRALVYLRAECLDQVGLFRRSGVKSRIQYLRELVESDPDGVSYHGQSAFDVADMVKQYFRDLPEPVFTSKLCESFLHIYQYFPKDQQLVAAQAAILLLPDENRVALRVLLLFLRDVVACVDENQMTPTNIAVCLAPSLFHLNAPKRDANAARRERRWNRQQGHEHHGSSHRKYSLGRPDQRDLSENLAAAQGLADMITEAHRLFQLPEFWPGHRSGAAGCSEDSLSEGGGREEEQEKRRSKLQLSTKRLLKEAGEQSAAWESHPAPEHVQLTFKRLDDGCLLRMWRGSVEVEVPQAELLHRLLRERRLWEGSLRRADVVQALSEHAEVYRYLLEGRGRALGSRLSRDHLLLRTWQADPSCGPVYLSSVSTEHPEVQPEGVRAHVHACLYLLEPSGAGGTRLTHVCRTDPRGRSLEWHSKVSGLLLASGLLAIRDSFGAEHKDTPPAEGS